MHLQYPFNSVNTLESNIDPTNISMGYYSICIARHVTMYSCSEIVLHDVGLISQLVIKFSSPMYFRKFCALVFTLTVKINCYFLSFCRHSLHCDAPLESDPRSQVIDPEA